MKPKSKSQRARDYAAKHPKATVRQVADKVGTSYVIAYQALHPKPAKTSNLTWNIEAKRGLREIRVKATPNGELSVQDLLAVKASVDSLGGIDRAKQAIEMYEKLVA